MRLVVVSNRVASSQPRAKASAGGLATAVSAALNHFGGLWFGWSGDISPAASSESAAHEDGRIRYATIDLSPEDYDAYYCGFANQAIWPLFHYRTGLAATRRSFAEGYYRVNKLFADALTPLLRGDDLIWVHDYHLLPLAGELRARGSRHKIGFFLHIPWPAREVLSALPGHKELVERLFSYDVVGFQTPDHLNAFVDYVVTMENGRLLDGGRLSCFGREITVGAYPIGCDAEQFSRDAADMPGSGALMRIQESVAGRDMIIGVDRLDYSKGLDRRLRSYALLLEKFPEFHRNVFMLQIAPASRSDVPEYKRMRRELERLSGEINGRYADFDWVPIRYVNRPHPPAALANLYRASRIGFVTPVRDGMNLVAKEYVASQDEKNPGVLILSQFAGAAHQMRSALIVNPYDEDEMADALRQGLKMPLRERLARWQALMHGVRTHNVHVWWQSFLESLQNATDSERKNPIAKPDLVSAVPLKSPKTA